MRRIYFILSLLVCTMLASCTSLRYEEAAPDDQARLQALVTQWYDRPEDAILNREIGAIYMRMQRPADAQSYLEKAIELLPDDPEILFYRGLYAEMEEGIAEALPYYERYPEVSQQSSYRRLMEARYTWLSQELIREEMRQQVANESSLAPGAIESDMLAVFPLQVQAADSVYRTLGLGFSEMIIADLSKVPGLRLVERVRLQAVLDELQLAQSEFADPQSTPRTGRLLGAGILAGGSLNISDSDVLRVDFATWTPVSEQDPSYLNRDGLLRNLFVIEKEIVFALINRFGITLSPEDRNRIERIPTQNLQAFLAFSRGLDAENRGLYSSASSLYGQAAALDSGFEIARTYAENAASMAAGSVSISEAIDAANDSNGGEGVPSGVVDLMALRILNLGGGILVGTEEGSEDRQPAAEAISAGVQQLPEPPLPPTGN